MSQPPASLEYPPTVPRSRWLIWRELPLARSIGSILGALLGLILVLAIFGLWRPNKFLTANNVNNVLRYNYQYIVVSIGMTFVIITAGIDLSVGSTMALAGVACAMAMTG